MKMKSGEFITLSACTMMLTALGIDIMLPAFASLRQHFGFKPESTATAQVIVFFFMGQIAQLFFGILSDRFGRLAIYRIGFPLYIVGGLVAAFAPTFEIMLAARFFAGVGASAVFMTTIAGVRDRFVGDQMARTMSLIFTIFLFTPVIAPFLGLAILSVSSWQMVFLTPVIFGLAIFIWSFRMEETHPVEKRTALNWSSVAFSLKSVLSNRPFLRYTTITTLLFSALSTWVATSEHIVGGIYGKPELFAWVFAGIGLLMSLCTFFNSYFTTRIGARRSIKWLLVAYATVASVLFIITIVFGEPPHLLVFFVGIALLMAINIAIEPNSSALALEPMGDIAGVASSVYGTFFFFIGSTLGSVVSFFMTDSVFPLILSFFVIGIINLVLIFGGNKGKSS
ncbi:MFS transporter [Lacihabitans sp. CCS-44]|nr:MFS transporter [Lacihabitans sp. CCS-44]